MFGAVGAIPSKKLCGYVGAPQRVGQAAGAPRALFSRRRHHILQPRLRAGF
jgi:hypothetical protein